jgi:hypothetical protein
VNATGQRTARSKHTGSTCQRYTKLQGRSDISGEQVWPASHGLHSSGCARAATHAISASHVGRSQYGHGSQLETCNMSFTSLARLFLAPERGWRTTSCLRHGISRRRQGPLRARLRQHAVQSTNGVMPKASLVDLEFTGPADYSVVAMSQIDRPNSWN